jgi:hypothetical protein
VAKFSFASCFYSFVKSPPGDTFPAGSFCRKSSHMSMSNAVHACGICHFISALPFVVPLSLCRLE